MTKLNQIIAIEKTVKSTASKELTTAYQRFEKRDQLTGFTKTYRPLDEENGEKLPPETKKVQYSINDTLKALRPSLERMFDVVATKEFNNTQAKADVVVNGVVIVKDAPVTFLLFLEKQLTDLHTFVEKFPTLAPDQDWSTDPISGLWRTKERETHRTKKETKHTVVVPPTDKHPAQVAVVTEDVVAGHWTAISYSGEMSPVEVKAMLAKIEDLQRAVKYAREQANSTEIEDKTVGASVLGYIFGK